MDYYFYIAKGNYLVLVFRLKLMLQGEEISWIKEDVWIKTFINSLKDKHNTKPQYYGL